MPDPQELALSLRRSTHLVVSKLGSRRLIVNLRDSSVGIEIVSSEVVVPGDQRGRALFLGERSAEQVVSES